ncbi:hypothetical protein Tco_0517566 [Tanacetum coccineum]
MASHVNWLQCSLQAKIKKNDKNEVQYSLRISLTIYLNTPALFLQLVDETNTSGHHEVSELAACLEECFIFLALAGHGEVWQNLHLICPLEVLYRNTSAVDMNYA